MHLTELESRLSQPGGVAVQAECLKHLRELELRIHEQLLRGVPPSMFELYDQTLAGVKAALVVLEASPVNTDPVLQFAANPEQALTRLPVPARFKD